MKIEIKDELLKHIVPYWMGLKDMDKGGYYGYMSYDLKLDKKAVKGCILNSRIMWFFSSVYELYKDGAITEEECKSAGYDVKDILEAAGHAYRFFEKNCFDKENGGLLWSVEFDGTPSDTTKHTYNQAFCIYALCAYYNVSGDIKALDYAHKLYQVIEEKMRDEGGYLEAFTIDFKPESNEKLSENGVIAERTMNTLLHVLEAYTEFLRVLKLKGEKPEMVVELTDKLKWILSIFAEKMYNSKLKRQEVFFDHEYNTLIDLHSYGHDIETSWLVDRALEVIDDSDFSKNVYEITASLADTIINTAFDGRSLANECEKGSVDNKRVWWVQAETLVGFLNAYEKSGQDRYLVAAKSEWEFIRDNLVDKREGSEWFHDLYQNGSPMENLPILEPWKCPYHNGRMCMEALRRLS